MRSNISIAMLAMTAQVGDNNSKSFSSCISEKSSNITQDHKYDFDWTQSEQGSILSSFFIGYFSTHILGALSSIFIGPRYTMIICLLGATIFTFSMTILPYYGVKFLILGRVMIGFFSGPLYPIVHELIANYAPEKERTKLNVLTHTGNILGLAFNFGVGGYIVENFSQGWKGLFIMNGALGAVVLILCAIFLYSTPIENPMMGEKEKKLIMGVSYKLKENSHHKSLRDIPFISILTCPKVYFICLAQFGNSIILYAQLTGHPKFLSSVYGLSKQKSSFLSIIPFLSNFVFQLIYPFLFDFERAKKLMSKTSYRKFNTALAFIGSAVFLVPVASVKCEKMFLSVLFVSLSMVFLAMNQCGFFTAMIDISPSNAGIIMSVASMFGSLSGVIQPNIVAFYTHQGDRKFGYMKTFCLTGLIALMAGLPFVLFGSSEEIIWKHKVDSYVPIETLEDKSSEKNTEA